MPMNIYDFKIYRWLFSTPYRALHRAYEASKKVRNIQRDYLFYKNAGGAVASKRSFYNVTLYIDNILNQKASNIFWSLLEFKISIILCNFIVSVGCPTMSREKNNIISLNIYTRSFKQKVRNVSLNYKNFLKIQNNISSSSKKLSFTSSIEKNCFFLKKYYNKNLDWERWNRKLMWIEAVLIDLEILKNKGWFSSEVFLSQRDQQSYTVLNNLYKPSLLTGPSIESSKEKQTSRSRSPLTQTSFQYNERINGKKFWFLNQRNRRTSQGLQKVKDTAYESLGLVPRSITRTLSRFQTELAGRSASLVLPEFRLAKYQAITSLKYLAFLIFCPWIVLSICKVLFLEPLIENWWNTAQFQIFLSFSQEEKALKRLQQVEELLWLDIIMADSSAKQPQDLSAQIHQRTIDLVETYNQESIQTILHFFTNFILIFVIISLLIWGKKRLAILNSWVQEVFYSLSDTMKAFFILLFTDLCIGFHSPHGWEIFIGFILEHLGFSHNKHVISCFVSTFPVILDTVFKYWIFRHLNRISPSIVVSYHTMNE